MTATMGDLIGKLGDDVERDQAPEAWETPVPLTAARTLPPFPVEALPGWLAKYVEALAEATQTPVDLGGMLAVSALATVAGRIVDVEARPGWVEPVNLYTATALKPGSRKSAVFSAVTKPILTFERTLVESVEAEILQLSVEKKIAERQAEAAQAEAGKATNGEVVGKTADAIKAAEHAAAIEVPPIPQLLADDATPEALASLLAEQGERIALLSPEGDLFDMMAGRYSNAGPQLAVYLKGHAGDQLRVNRKGRAAEHLHRPALTIGLAVQPDVIQSLADKPGFRGKGLLARFLFSLPTDTVGKRTIRPPAVPDDVAQNYDRNLRALAFSLRDEATLKGTPGGSADSAEYCGNPAGGSSSQVNGDSADTADCAAYTLRLNEDAEELLADWERELEPQLGPGGDLAYVADWGSKLAGATVRIAGLLHLAEHLRDGWALPIDAVTMRRAITLGRYLIVHALAVFDLMGADATVAAAARVLAWLADHGTERFTVRELFSALPRGQFPKVEALDEPLGILVEHGYLRRLPAPERKGAGRPPSPMFESNPLWERSS